MRADRDWLFPGNTQRNVIEPETSIEPHVYRTIINNNQLIIDQHMSKLIHSETFDQT